MPENQHASLQREILHLRAAAWVREQHGILPAAASDLARHLIDNGLELRGDGRLRMAHGGDIADALSGLRNTVPNYFADATPAADEGPVVQPAPAAYLLPGRGKSRRAKAADRLAIANGDDLEPRL